MRSRKFDGLTVEVHEEKEELVRRAAEMLFDQLRQKRNSVLGLATGSTFIPFYAYVAANYRKAGITFRDAVTFNLDEYYPIDKESGDSYHSYMNENLFSKVDANPYNIHIPDGSTDDPEAEVKQYEIEIQRYGGIDLQFLGIGTNGHIGFNEPGTPFGSRTHVTRLTESTLASNRPLFSSSVSSIPARAITMGIATIMSSRRIVMIACGKSKSGAVSSALMGPVTEEVPASVLRTHGNATFIVDEEALNGLF